MIGGRIQSVSRKDGVATIVVRGTGSDRGRILRVQTRHQGEIPTGGSIWWQSRSLLVRAPGAKAEKDIGRIGYSY